MTVATVPDPKAAAPAATMRMEYWKPSPRLEGLVSGYHLYAVAPSAGEVHSDVFQPAWFNLRVLLDPQTHWQVRCGSPEAIGVPDMSLFGPSSAACWSQSNVGTVIGAGITPLGWTRLSALPAADLANRVVPARDVFGTGVERLAHRLRTCSDPRAIPAIFDEWFLERMTPPQRDEEAIARLFAALLDPNLRTVRQLSEALGYVPRTLERLSLKAFGFPPKLLIRRARFLRSLHALIRGGPGRRALAIDAGYTDYSHFIREAHEFLGMKPTQFLEACGPMFTRSLALRQAVLGAPAQALTDSAKP
ncbi:helix-turn-helix domain-containing protein [Novosphingobium jiangmenense]|uniref:AraC family transcriptional regulator n=1 Tax=Novosphingobium jiangmenense TaxID=2791981 RepID=A0ABS0HBA2_9SPHN|nr:helix-turn-helix domain-containing protein [Novosphingobium jiangmenense]MBF9149560.1 AraC family transcriptional regulator [Novosphingobium jiangmenense]